MNFYAVRIILNGFEAVSIFCGEEESVKNYVSSYFQTVLSIAQIAEGLATDLARIGYKIYYVPTIPTQDIEKEAEETEIEAVISE